MTGVWPTSNHCLNASLLELLDGKQDAAPPDERRHVQILSLV